MDVAATIFVALALLVATVVIHYEVLSATFAVLPRLTLQPRYRILVAMGAIFGAHLTEISLYAVAFYAMERLQLGSIGGDFNGDWLDFFYFSTTSYTTMGVGDVAPHGLLRLVAGLEGLNGFVLIGWSASFTYVTMEAYWRGDDEKPGRFARVVVTIIWNSQPSGSGHLGMGMGLENAASPGHAPPTSASRSGNKAMRRSFASASSWRNQYEIPSRTLRRDPA